jgi:hypothetical protein
MSGGGAAEYAIKVFGNTDQQVAGANGAIKMNPVMTGGKNKNKKNKSNKNNIRGGKKNKSNKNKKSNKNNIRGGKKNKTMRGGK